MNRLPAAPSCRICGTDLNERLRRTTGILLRAQLGRQITNGMCDGCQLARLTGAIEYEDAMAEVRLVMELGAAWSRSRPPSAHPALRYARWRRTEAEAACVRLKMWPATRPVREGKK